MRKFLTPFLTLLAATTFAADLPVCTFCNPNTASEAILQTDKYYAKTNYGTLGQEGYVVMVPKFHVPSSAEIPALEHESVVQSREAIAHGMRGAAYERIVVLEHGVTGQSIGHPHFHFIPGISYEQMLTETEKLLETNGIRVQTVHITASQELAVKMQARAQAGGYLYISDPASGRAAIYPVAPNDTLKMILRKAAANVLGKPELADWRKIRLTPGLVEADEAIRQKANLRLFDAFKEQKNLASALEGKIPAGPLPQRGLLIRSPWIYMIMDGHKDWEIRGTKTSIRGPVALIQSKTGKIFGTADLVDSIGPLSLKELQDTLPRHRIPAQELAQNTPYKKTFAWVLKNPRWFLFPVPYKHPSGAVIWVNLAKKLAH